MTHTHLSHEFLKAFAVHRRSTGMTQISIDDNNALRRPTQCDGSLLQRVLTLGALRIFQHLPRRGLSNVEIGIAFQVCRVHLLQVSSHRMASGRECKMMAARMAAA